MQIIDTHVHLIHNPLMEPWIDDGMEALKTPFALEDIGTLLEQNGVSGCVLVQADHSVAETEQYLMAAEENGFIRGVVGYVQLTDPWVAWRIDKLLEVSQTLVGIRHILHDQKDVRFCLQEDFVAGLKAVWEKRLAYDLLIKPQHLAAVKELVSKRELREMTWVIDHIAKPRISKKGIPEQWKVGMAELESTKRRIFVKLSGMVNEAEADVELADYYLYLDCVLETFGIERVMFGSDSPVWRLKGKEYPNILEIVTNWMSERGFSADERDKVMSENAIQAYGLTV